MENENFLLYAGLAILCLIGYIAYVILWKKAAQETFKDQLHEDAATWEWDEDLIN